MLALARPLRSLRLAFSPSSWLLLGALVALSWSSPGFGRFLLCCPSLSLWLLVFPGGSFAFLPLRRLPFPLSGSFSLLPFWSALFGLVVFPPFAAAVAFTFSLIFLFFARSCLPWSSRSPVRLVDPSVAAACRSALCDFGSYLPVRPVCGLYLSVRPGLVAGFASPRPAFR